MTLSATPAALEDEEIEEETETGVAGLFKTSDAAGEGAGKGGSWVVEGGADMSVSMVGNQSNKVAEEEVKSFVLNKSM
ncbi:hypothetical protein MtrunA17_Chr4g0068531 [Medicago truncatula]|uniref:Uncharacterized protein n=1 Tax=Medicago truncatula TaxID=3880 RepID=A0A396IHP3_MEDTR|nr:hypothetical protein MtrunA17_Chr4g0068531 [Medicago truncatula]